VREHAAAERQVALLTDELNETWATIHNDVLSMMAVARHKTVTAQLLHDTVDIGVSIIVTISLDV